jgi:hypothetical protein
MSSKEELFVGIIALALVPLIAWRTVRGLRSGRLPLYRSYVGRDEGGRFKLLLALHAASLLLVAIVAVDLLFGLGLRERL